MKNLKAQLEVKTQEYQETILNWKKGEETLRRKISQWKEVIGGLNRPNSGRAELIELNKERTEVLSL